MMKLAIQVAGCVVAARGGFPDGPNQQCFDDAGPPWGDDGPVAYYDGFPNKPVLPASGECPTPLSAACVAKGLLSAYLDGPIDCGGKGWFCRIFDQPDHRMPGMSAGVFPDSNFASCNQSDSDHDLDGHCHGSDVDDVYGWWVRDHWHRNYAGKLKCCCDWQATVGVVNRCDYRKHVTAAALATCRDANEEHNVDWGPGCTQDHFQNYREPPAETCWELDFFGPGPHDEPPQSPTGRPTTSAPTAGPTTPAPTGTTTAAPSTSGGPTAAPGSCPQRQVRSQATGACVAVPWNDFETCAEEVYGEEACDEDEWIAEHCCQTCNRCVRTTTTTTSPEAAAGWSAMDGGSGRACRGSDASDNSASYYQLHTGVAAQEDCKKKCEETSGCQGIEHNPNGRCEVWTRTGGIQASRAVTGFTCLRYSTGMGGPVQPFVPVGGGVNRVCRGATPDDNDASYYEVHVGVDTLQACKAKCAATAGCQGIEYKQQPGRCEVWTRTAGIEASRRASGFSCFRYTASAVLLDASKARRQVLRGRRQSAVLGLALLQGRSATESGVLEADREQEL